MIIARVIGNIWATRKDETLKGIKFLVLEPVGNNGLKYLVAGDLIGAGIGEHVLVTTGSSARQQMNLKESPIDAVVVGIIDREQGPEISVLLTGGKGDQG